MAKLGDLARSDVPILHVCGSIDPLLGRVSNPVEEIYRAYGGRISVILKEGTGHHPHSLRDCTPIADFIVQMSTPHELVRFDDGSVRYFSVRECARLQTFPDDWTFEGSWTETMRQLGNSVPMKMCEVIASQLAGLLNKKQAYTNG